MKHDSKYNKLKKLFPEATKNLLIADGKIDTRTIDYADMKKMLEAFLELKTQINGKSEELHQVLTQFDALEILLSAFNKSIKHHDSLRTPQTNRLTDINIDIVKFFDDLDAEISSIPSTPLFVTIPLPYSETPENQFKITPFITISSGFQTEYHVSDSITDQIRQKLNQANTTRCATLTINGFGYPSQDIQNPSIQNKLITYKTLIMACDLLSIAYFPMPNYRNSKLYSMTASTPLKKSHIRLPSSINDSLTELKLTPTTFEDTEKFSKLNTLLDGESEDLTKIRSALPWLFDSYFSESIINTIINTSISLESLFSDNDKNNIMEKLKAKFAYSRGLTYSERKYLEEIMDKFYSARSKIVHGRPLKQMHDLEKIVNKIRLLLKVEIASQINFLSKNSIKGRFSE